MATAKPKKKRRKATGAKANPFAAAKTKKPAAKKKAPAAKKAAPRKAPAKKAAPAAGKAKPRAPKAGVRSTMGKAENGFMVRLSGGGKPVRTFVAKTLTEASAITAKAMRGGGAKAKAKKKPAR